MVAFLVVILTYLTRSNSREGVLGDAVHHGEEDMAVEARGRR